MSVREYIGARYVPLFADPIEWNGSSTYEPLTIVQHAGNSYTSRQYVPAGIDIADTAYWALTGNYNAQIEGYRQEVSAIETQIEAIETQIEAIESDMPEKYDDIIGIDDIDTASLPTSRTLIVVDNGTLNTFDNVTFGGNIDFFFINGTLGGNFNIYGKIYASSNQQIFEANADVAVGSANEYYFVDWFGVKSADSSAQTAITNTTILNKLFAMSEARFKMRGATYYTSGTLYINKSNVSLEGTKYARGTSNIRCIANNAPILKIGDETLTVPNMVSTIRIENVNLIFDTQAATDSGICLQAISCSGCEFTNMYFTNGTIGVQLSNTVGCRFYKCHFNMSNSGLAPSLACFDAVTLAQNHYFAYSENPSLHIDACSASLTQYKANTYGYRFRANGFGPSDTFINDFTLTNFEYGIYFDLSNPSPSIHGAQNINLTNLIFDVVRCGLKIYSSTGTWAPVQLNLADSYISTNPNAGDCAGIDIYSEFANDYRYVQLTMSGCIIESPANASANTTGMKICANGVSVNGCSFRYFNKILRGYGTACNFKLSHHSDVINTEDTAIIFDGTQNYFEIVETSRGANQGSGTIGTMFDCVSALRNSVFNMASVKKQTFVNIYADKAFFNDLASSPYTVNASGNSQIGA